MPTKNNTMTVYVITNPEAGWDCVRGVFKTERSAKLSKLEDYVEEGEDAEFLSNEKIDELWNKHGFEDRFVIHQTTLRD